MPAISIIKRKIITMFHNNNTVLDECSLINVKRAYYLSMIAIPMRVLDIIMFSSSSTSLLRTWKQGILICHSVLFVFYSGVFLITLRLKNRVDTNAAIYALQYIVTITIMLSGIVIVTIDQLVTTNITPLLIASIVVGAIFLIRPLVSTIIYLASYLCYYYLISLTIVEHQVLLSNRVNGVTAFALGLFLSVMTWQYNYISITQKRRIKKQQEQLERMAYYDSLTGLCNMHFFNRMIKKEISSAQRYQHETVIMILDIDEFKNINDTYGHLVGDQILKQLSQLLISNVREADMVFRYGGEEFIILAPNTTLEEGFVLAEKLRKLIAEKEFKADSATTHLTASLGLSLLNTDKDRGVEITLSNADKALYLAKKQGKNRVEKNPKAKDSLPKP
jgi:diguanylate cyclase (GGDEF)-like protein